MTPERREIARQRTAAWRAALAKDPAALAAYRKRQAERQQARRDRAKAARPGPMVGSVLGASADGPGRALLAAVTAQAPKADDRDELIAEAVLMVLEGATVANAVAEAKRQVMRRARPLRYTVPVEACPWL